MATGNQNHKLLHWEVSLVKAMLAKGTFGNDQDILAYFTRPTRSINHRAIAEIRTGKKHTRVIPATDEELQHFLDTWPQIDSETGLHILGDELLIKAREAMTQAVQVYNNPRTHFRSETFIVTAIIAWTYLIHAYYKSEGVDYRHKKNVRGVETVQTTANGAEKYWELGQCLKAPQCPIDDEATKRNLLFLIDIRHEIEHRMTNQIDVALSAKLQACCLNFNRTLKKLFGDHYGLDSDLSFALQFASIDFEQKKALMAENTLPPHIETVRASYEDDLSAEEYNDPNYAYRVLFVPKVVNKKAQADNVMELVPAGSDEAKTMNKAYLKEVEKTKYRPGMIVDLMHADGFPNFSMHNHTKLWQSLDAQNPDKGYGVETVADGWRWYERWVEAVRQHCIENRGKYE